VMPKSQSPQDLKTPIKIVVVSNALALVFAGAAVILTFMGVFPFQSPDGIYRILPGGILLDFIWIWLISVVVGIGIYYVTPRMAYFVIQFHRALSGGVYNYHFQVRDKEREYSRHFGKIIVPALTALGLSFTVTNMVGLADILFVTESFDSLPPAVAEPLKTSMPIFFVLLLISTVIPILFAASWLLEDLGVICERKTEGTGITADIEGVGNWYLALLKGFAGISTILAYFFIMVQMVQWYQMLPIYGVEVPIWFYLVPVLVVILSPLIAVAPISISYLLYNMTEAKEREKLKAMLAAKGLKRVVVDVREVGRDSKLAGSI
jgi:hypothetical protein